MAYPRRRPYAVPCDAKLSLRAKDIFFCAQKKFCNTWHLTCETFQNFRCAQNIYLLRAKDSIWPMFCAQRMFWNVRHTRRADCFKNLLRAKIYLLRATKVLKRLARYIDVPNVSKHSLRAKDLTVKLSHISCAQKIVSPNVSKVKRNITGRSIQKLLNWQVMYIYWVWGQRGSGVEWCHGCWEACVWSFKWIPLTVKTL